MTTSRRDRWQASLPSRAWRQTRTKIGVALATPVVLVAVFGPLFAGSATEFVGIPLASTSTVPPFGTDILGRDVWARYLNGGFSTLAVALTATIIGVGLGCVFGLATAMSRSRLGEICGRAMDLVLVFPLYVLVLVVVSVFSGPSVIFVIAIAFIPIVGRVIRSAALEVTRREHVQYARLLGCSRWDILRREVLPAVTGPLSVEAGLRLTFAIALVASLSYLGFGPPPPTPDWGTMISENQIGLQIQPWGVLLPVLTIAVLTVGTNLVAEGFAAASSSRTGHHNEQPVTETGLTVAPGAADVHENDHLGAVARNATNAPEVRQP